MNVIEWLKTASEEEIFFFLYFHNREISSMRKIRALLSSNIEDAEIEEIKGFIKEGV